MNTLIVPIRVYAIYQTGDRAVVGPEMDFESLPYFDNKSGLDINPDRPYLAESVIPRPFEDANFLLEHGVHLNWDFPPFLKRTKYGAQNAMEFPPVPTRWLVSRFEGDGKKPDRQWAVESDALLTDFEGAKIYDMAQTSLPADINSGKRPFTYMGHAEPFQDFVARGGQAPAQFDTWKNLQDGHPLTALGWGSPSFDIFYPNCRGVFGFHDSTGTASHTYRVIGLYGDIADDYWLFYLNEKSGKWGFSEIEALAHLDKQRKADLCQEQFTKQLRADLGIEIPYAHNIDDANSWARMMCCGNSEFLPEHLLAQDQTLFAIGNTPIEALTALLAENLPGETSDIAALTALSVETSDLKREKLEDSLAAILMGDRLKSQKLDIGPKFREFRHADEFVGSGGGLQWVVENIDDNPQKTPQGEQPDKDLKLPPPLPAHLLPLLETLNAAQRDFDRAERELESSRFELYADWYRYMHAAYPPPGETEEYVEASSLRAMIAAGSLREVQNGKERLGGKKPDKDGNLGYSGVAAKVESANNDLERELSSINAVIKADANIVEKFHWETQHRPAPRFWEPAPPAVVIAIPRADSDASPALSPAQSDASPAETSALQTALPCQWFAGLSSVDELFQADDSHWSVPGKPLSTDLPIFRGEWEVAVYPAATMNPLTRSAGTYDPNFILNNYRLGENEPDLVDHPKLESNLALTSPGNIYTGSTYVNQNLDDRYRGLLRTYIDLQSARKQSLEAELKNITVVASVEHTSKAAELAQLDMFSRTAQQAEDFLDKHDLLVITLNGFNSALLQRHESIQLNPADPLGFADYKAFAQDVAAALENNFKGVSPDPHAPFMPIRSGALQVITLRLVDRFGRFVELTPTNVATALPMTVAGHPDWVRLLPRLSQAARWNFRFLQAEADSPTESDSHPLSTPVHGWIVPNLLDHSLDFFDPVGRRLGSIRQGDTLAWESAGDTQPTGFMHKAVKWITDTDKSARFMEAFIEGIEEALDNIHPDDREGQSAFSVLMGRPLAVVELGVELELEGLPAVNNSWSDLYRDLRGENRSTDEFDLVKFPYRLGEYRQRNDGLVGYWAIADGRLEPNFYVNDAVSGRLEIAKFPKAGASSGDTWLDGKNEEWALQDEEGRKLFDYLRAKLDGTIKKQDLIQPYIREGSRVWGQLKAKGYLVEEKRYEGIRQYAEADALSLSPAEGMQQFIALLDPHGVIHLSSGIQPVKEIQLPEQFITDALNRIEMSFLTAPLLTPEDHLQLSLPTDQAFRWVWREANSWPTRAGEATEEVEIPETAIQPFQTAANFPNRNVLREGLLILQHKPIASGKNEIQAPANKPVS